MVSNYQLTRLRRLTGEPCKNYPNDIDYPPFFVSGLEGENAMWRAQCPEEMPIGRFGANCQPEDSLALPHPTSVNLAYSENLSDVQTSGESDYSISLEGSPMIIDSIWDWQCPLSTPSSLSGIAFDEQERQLLEEIKEKYRRYPQPCTSSLRVTQAQHMYLGGSPTIKNDNTPEPRTPCIKQSTKKVGQHQGKGSPLCDESPKPTKARGKKDRVRHNVVEQRYRENLNTRIMQLRERIPSLQKLGNAEGDSDLSNMKKTTICKATVLLEAGDYIEELQHQTTRLQHQNEVLESLVQRLVAALEDSSKPVDPSLTVSIARTSQA